jgi:hypothetical protein
MATFGKLEGDLGQSWIQRKASDGDPARLPTCSFAWRSTISPSWADTELTGKDGGPVVIDFGVDLSAATK